MTPARLKLHAASALALAAGFACGWAALRWLAPGGGSEGAGGPGGLDLLELPEPPAAAGDWDASLGSAPCFTDVTRAAGISFHHENGLTGKFHYPEIMGAGVALLDYNGDGYLDVYFVNGNRLLGEPSAEIKNRLYRSNGDGTFTDVTDRAGAGDTGFGQGACAGDYDNDGDPDLYVSNLGPNVLYRNNGDGTFTDVAARAGVADPAWGQTCSFLDFDGDGSLDLYVQNYLTFPPGTVVEAFIYVGGRKVLDYPSPLEFRGSPDRLYRSNGDGTFTDVTRQAGLYREDGKGMGCACADLDGDGWTDIFVANDTAENFLFLNRGHGTFREAGLACGVAYDGGGIPEASMGVDVGDADGDGLPDLIVPCLTRQVYTLYRNLGGHFTDASVPAGLAPATSRATGFNANFLDYDNDGDLDIFFTQGGVRRGELVPPEASYTESYGIPDLLVANDGKGRYRDVSARAGRYFRERLIGRGSAAGDLDNDGDLDLVVSNLAGPAAVLRNDTAPRGHWLQVKLVARRGNRDALGASVCVEAGGRRQRGMVHGGVTYLSQNDRRLHFGLGESPRAVRLEVLWPGGGRQTFEDLPADRLWVIEEGSAPR